MLEVKNLTKTYGENKSVADISFTVEKGETVGLLGPNGAGKSTTMRMITGYLTPTSGVVTINGVNVAEDPIRARKSLGYLPEIPPLYMDMTVREHLGFVCELRKIPAARAAAEIDRVCGCLNISHVADRLIRNLSKGYRQRVGFAASLAGDPELLILDEPTVGLDPAQIVEIRGLIRQLSETMTIIISSHILSEIASVCSRIIMLNKGRLVADGTPRQIEEQHTDAERVMLTVKGGAERAESVLRDCIGGRARVDRLPGENDAMAETGAGNEADQDREQRQNRDQGQDQGQGGQAQKQDQGQGQAQDQGQGQGQAQDQDQETVSFLVTAPKGTDLREDIFKAFAGESAKGESLSLLTLALQQKTLEDIFMDVIEGR